MSSMCSNARSKTWMPLPDCFIDKHLVEMFPLFDQVNVMNPVVIHTLLQLPPICSLPGSGQDCWLATELVQ